MVKENTAIKEKMLYYVDLQGIKRADFFRRIEITDSVFRGRALSTDVQSSILIKFLEEFPEINPGWLLLGEEPMLRVPSAEPLSDSAPKHGIPLINIKAYDGFNCGTFANHIHTIKDYYSIPKFENRGVDFLFEVEGLSMSPSYNPGDIIGCKIEVDTERIRWNEPYLISTLTGDLLIKRIVQGEKPKTVGFVSDNQDYGTYNIPAKEIKGLALVLGTIK